MKITRILTASLCILSISASLAFAAEGNADKKDKAKEQKLPACCEKAKADGKECTHKCCVEARKEGKVCEKCPVAKDDKKKDDKKDANKA